MISEQIYYCEKCGFASRDRFIIEYHESIPDPPALPVKIGDQIWVETWISPEMEERGGETESPVLRTITAIGHASCPYGYKHQWEIYLDVPVMIDYPEGYHIESYSIDRVRFLTKDKMSVDMNDYAIRAHPQYKYSREMQIRFYENFSG